MLKRTLLLLVLAVAAVFAVACDDASEEGMAIFGVSDINPPDFGPITSMGGSGATVGMTFRWRPYLDSDLVITEAAPHGDYVIDHYRVSWTAISAGVTPPPAREQATNIFVPVYELVDAGIVVATPAEAAGIPAGSIMNAHIDFTAHEMGTTKDAKFGITVSVYFN